MMHSLNDQLENLDWTKLFFLHYYFFPGGGGGLYYFI